MKKCEGCGFGALATLYASQERAACLERKLSTQSCHRCPASHSQHRRQNPALHMLSPSHTHPRPSPTATPQAARTNASRGVLRCIKFTHSCAAYSAIHTTFAAKHRDCSLYQPFTCSPSLPPRRAAKCSGGSRRACVLFLLIVRPVMDQLTLDPARIWVRARECEDGGAE